MAAPAASLLLYLDQGTGLIDLTDDGTDRAKFGIHRLPAAIRRDIEEGPQFECHRLTGAEDSRADGADWTIHHFGDLLVGQPVNFAQDDRPAQLFGCLLYTSRCV